MCFRRQHRCLFRKLICFVQKWNKNLDVKDLGENKSPRSFFYGQVTGHGHICIMTILTPEEIQEIFSELTGKQVDKIFGMFPPFYTDCGKNIAFSVCTKYQNPMSFIRSIFSPFLSAKERLFHFAYQCPLGSANTRFLRPRSFEKYSFPSTL